MWSDFDFFFDNVFKCDDTKTTTGVFTIVLVSHLGNKVSYSSSLSWRLVVCPRKLIIIGTAVVIVVLFYFDFFFDDVFDNDDAT